MSPGGALRVQGLCSTDSSGLAGDPRRPLLRRNNRVSHLVAEDLASSERVHIVIPGIELGLRSHPSTHLRWAIRALARPCATRSGVAAVDPPVPVTLRSVARLDSTGDEWPRRGVISDRVDLAQHGGKQRRGTSPNRRRIHSDPAEHRHQIGRPPRRLSVNEPRQRRDEPAWAFTGQPRDCTGQV